MNSNKKWFYLQTVALSLSLILLSACSSVDKTLYKDARTLPPLEIPPNLMAPEVADGVEMTTQTDDVSAGKSALIWERDGGLIMVLNLDYATAWLLIGDVLKAQGFSIKNESKAKGLYTLQLQGTSKQLSVEDRGVKILVTMIGSKNQRDHSAEAYQVLSKIHAELK
ncbi:MAG: outer membrane protein assembly factor BamC [Gammaproteobacteria bacterium]|nr:outer membrane protein assembly factor BamC [Gammaproteobacteria bacterium]